MGGVTAWMKRVGMFSIRWLGLAGSCDEAWPELGTGSSPGFYPTPAAASRPAARDEVAQVGSETLRSARAVPFAAESANDPNPFDSGVLTLGLLRVMYSTVST